MRIQSITTNTFRPTFKNEQYRKKAPDRAATVQELYDAEDRIKEHQQKLIEKQTRNLLNVIGGWAIDIKTKIDENNTDY